MNVTDISFISTDIEWHRYRYFAKYYERLHIRKLTLDGHYQSGNGDQFVFDRGHFQSTIRDQMYLRALRAYLRAQIKYLFNEKSIFPSTEQKQIFSNQLHLIITFYRTCIFLS